MSRAPQILRLPSQLNADTIPVGREGLWELFAQLKRGEPGVIELAPGQDLRGLANFFGIASRAAELAAAAGDVRDGKELALVAKRSDPMIVAAEEGRAFLHEGCGYLWSQDGVVEKCPCCGEEVYHTDVGAAGENAMEVEGPYTKMNRGDEWF